MTSETENLSDLINRAVLARMTPDFIEKAVDVRVGKLVDEAVADALRSYSDTGKLITEAVKGALKVERLDLPSYGHVVTAMLREQIEATVAPIVAGQLAADMAELLKLAPKEIKLSEIAEKMLQHHEGGEWGKKITVIVEESHYGSTWLYLDEHVHLERSAKGNAEVRILLGKDGQISSASLSGRDLKSGSVIGANYGLQQMVRAWHACGTVIILDEDAVVTSIGDW
jgi:hypothetical protein